MSKSDEKILQEIRDRYKLCTDDQDEVDNREAAVEDLEFLNGEQWPEGIKRDREKEGQPCLTINRAPGFVDQIIGDMRQNKPSIHVKPVDSGADPKIAEIFDGLIRQIEVTSQADIAYDTAGESSCACGYGAFRIVTDYTDDDAFEQEIKIKRVSNPFSVYFDPSAKEYDRSDARFAFVVDTLAKEEFERLYPKVEVGNFEDDNQQTGWWDGETVTICEYWKKERVDRTLYLLQDGSVVDKLFEGEVAVREREVNSHKIVWYKTNGSDILEGPSDWPGRYIPIVPVWGKEIFIKGKRYVRGLIRFMKDAQRAYNYSRSAHIETIALQPKAPYLMTPEQVNGFEGKWGLAYKKSYPYLLYNPDPRAPGAPQRQQPPTSSPGWVTEIQMAADEMKATTGIYDASLGQRSNETSGRAIMARQKEGDTSTFAYIDNIARALTYAGKILVDLIPRIYDTERVIRVRGEDDTENQIQVNTVAMDPQTGLPRRFNDLTVGKYDVVVTVGPSYTTQRMESAESMMQFMQAMPQSAQFIGDLIAKNMDWPGADKIAERLKMLLPPGMAQDDAGGPGQSMPGQPGQEGPQGPPQPQGPPPDPSIEIKAQQEQVRLEQMGTQAQIQIQQEQLRLEQEQLRLSGMQLDNEIKMARLKEALKPNPEPNSQGAQQ